MEKKLGRLGRLGKLSTRAYASQMQEETTKHRCCLQLIGSGAWDQVRLVMGLSTREPFPRRSMYCTTRN